MVILSYLFFFFSSRRRHTRCALVTGVQTCALPISGCDGVVSSGLEVERLRREAPSELICVTPGIRPVENRVEADQKRVMTPAAAIAAGEIGRASCRARVCQYV